MNLTFSSQQVYCGTIDKDTKTWNGKDTKFKCAMPMDIRVVCSLYKLTHASKYL